MSTGVIVTQHIQEQEGVSRQREPDGLVVGNGPGSSPEGGTEGRNKSGGDEGARFPPHTHTLTLLSSAFLAC